MNGGARDPLVDPLAEPLVDAVAALPPVDLADVVAHAHLQRRVDRKYLVPVGVAAEVVAALAAHGGHRALVVAGRRATTYRSTYLDDADLRCCRDHLQGRRLRWKARQRLYVEDALCRLEVKVRSGRGDTVKHALEVPAERYGCYDDQAAGQLGGLLALAGAIGAPGPLAGPRGALRPVLEVVYARSTLADLAAGERVTLDTAVVATPLHPAGGALRAGTVALDPRFVIVETKGGVRASALDHLLVARGHRPTSLSKYATSAALLSSAIADNTVRHHRTRHLLVTTKDAS